MSLTWKAEADSGGHGTQSFSALGMNSIEEEQLPL